MSHKSETWSYDDVSEKRFEGIKETRSTQKSMEVIFDASCKAFNEQYKKDLEVRKPQKLAKLFLLKEFSKSWNTGLSMEDIQRIYDQYISETKKRYEKKLKEKVNPFLALKLAIEEELWYSFYNKNSFSLSQLYIWKPWRIQCRSASINYVLTALSIFWNEMPEKNSQLVLIYVDTHVLPWYIKDGDVYWLEMTLKGFSQVKVYPVLKSKMLIVRAEHDISQSLLWLKWAKYYDKAIIYRWEELPKMAKKEAEEKSIISSPYSFSSWNKEVNEGDFIMNDIWWDDVMMFSKMWSIFMHDDTENISNITADDYFSFWTGAPL